MSGLARQQSHSFCSVSPLKRHRETTFQNTAIMSNRDSNEAHMRQKRARSQLSCTACRHGKLRCNRATPCDQCTKRSKESACSYLPPAAKARGPQDVKGRIQHLEQLVVDLMNSRSSNGNGTTTSSGRSNSTTTSNGDVPTNSQSEPSQLNTRVSSEVNTAHTEISPPYSDENSPVRQHSQDAQQQLESLGHLRISKEGTRYVIEDKENPGQQPPNGLLLRRLKLFFYIVECRSRMSDSPLRMLCCLLDNMHSMQFFRI
jgi:hypothetical protein